MSSTTFDLETTLFLETTFDLDMAFFFDTMFLLDATFLVETLTLLKSRHCVGHEGMGEAEPPVVSALLNQNTTYPDHPFDLDIVFPGHSTIGCLHNNG